MWIRSSVTAVFRSSVVSGFLTAIWLVVAPPAATGQERSSFDMLIVGDSHISGQGLREKDKFYSLVKDWLEDEVFLNTRSVNLKVKAHAGSRIFMHPEELAAMQKTGDDINKFHYAEANISTPTISAQIDLARAEYADPSSVDLVMLSGCITDVLVADIVNPFYPKSKLRKRIKRFCGESMRDLIAHTAASFPNAAIVIVGYFPIVSDKSDMKVMLRYFLNIISFPPKLHFFFTNPGSQLLFKGLQKRIAKRSKLWVDESNSAISMAVADFNRERPGRTVLFIEAPFSEDLSYGMENSYLWEIGKDHRPNDDTYADRKVGCAKTFSEMKYQHYGRLSRKMCELSSVAHPNVQGSQAYADAIKYSLGHVFFNRGLIIAN